MFTASGQIVNGTGELASLGVGSGTHHGLAGMIPNLGTSMGTQGGGGLLQGTGSSHLNIGLGASLQTQSGSGATLTQTLPKLANDLQTVRVQLFLLKDRMAEEADLPSHLKSEYRKSLIDIIEIVTSLQAKEQQTRRVFEKLVTEEVSRARDEFSKALKSSENDLEEMKAKVLTFARQIQAKYTMQSQLCDEALRTMASHLRKKEPEELKSNIKEFLKTQIEHRNLRYRLQSQLSSVRKPHPESERRREQGDYSACQESKGDEMQLLNCLEANRLNFEPSGRNLAPNEGLTGQPSPYILETPKAADKFMSRLANRKSHQEDYHQFILPGKEQENLLTFKHGHQMPILGDRGQDYQLGDGTKMAESRVLRDLGQSQRGQEAGPEPKSSAKKNTFTSDEYDMPDFTINSTNKKNAQIDSARIADKFDFSGSRAREMEEADLEDVLGARSLPISLKGSSTFQFTSKNIVVLQEVNEYLG